MHTIRHLVKIQVPREQVYHQLTNSEFIKQDNAFIRLTSGQHFTVVFDGTTEVVYQINEAIAGRCLVATYVRGHAEWEGTEIAFDCSERKDGTLLRLSHANWPVQNDYVASCNFRWAQLLDKFRIKCERLVSVNGSSVL